MGETHEKNTSTYPVNNPGQNDLYSLLKQLQDGQKQSQEKEQAVLHQNLLV